MQQGPSASQEIPCMLWNKKDYYNTHNILAIFRVMRHIH